MNYFYERLLQPWLSSISVTVRSEFLQYILAFIGSSVVERINITFCILPFYQILLQLSLEIKQSSRSYLPVPVAARSKAQVCGRSPAETWVRIPSKAWMFVCCECCVLSVRGLCDELVTRPEQSYRLWYVVVCDLETSRIRRPRPALGRSATANKKKGLI